MKKYLNKFFAFAIIMSLLLPSFFTVKTCAKGYDTYSIQCSGKWKKNNTGWWYENADGSYPQSEWKKINGSWYYFGNNGYMLESQWIGNYYVGSNGAMLVNTTTPDGYEVDENGKWI